MYGLVHTAIRDMIQTNYEPDVWSKIRDEAGVSDKDFLSMKCYDDAIVHNLVNAASNVLNVSTEDCLDAFGQFWVLNTAAKHYGNMLDSFGLDIWALLENLDHMHDRMSSTFSGYNPPSFHLVRHEDSVRLLHYRSSRQGLTPFVIGLLKGLSIHFQTDISIVVVEEVMNDKGQHTTFRLQAVAG